jgi:undecaprenyl-phosphate 4-deoxy-4-formamido-L-arabinose transferase
MTSGEQIKHGGSRKRVLLVDDHAVVRTGLATLINEESDMVACGEAENERSALETVQRLRPDVAVVDWSLKSRDASELLETMRQQHPRLPVLVLSIHDEVFYAERAMRAGARGYVMKREAADKIVEAIRHVAAGGYYLSGRAANALGCGDRQWMGENLAALAENGDLSVSASQNGARPRTTTLHCRTKPEAAVSIVIPVYNSEATIDRLCTLLIKELGRAYDLQIVLVDDGSGDSSADVCRALHERHPEVVDCVVLSRNFGEHNAVMAGLHCATGDYCVIMDDDFQNPPSEVRRLIEEIAKGYDVVYSRYESKEHSAFRNLGSRLHNWMATHALGKPAGLYLSSFKALSGFVVREAVHYTGPDPYLDAIILRTTRKIGVVTARHEPRQRGKSGYTLAKLISLWGNMLVAFSVYPLRLLSVLGILMSLAGACYGVATLVALASPSVQDPDGYEKLNAAMWFLRGLTLLAIGIVGEYVGRIHMHLSREPQFIVRRIQKHRPRN